MKKEKLQQTMQKYKRSYETTTSNYKMDNMKEVDKFLEKYSLPKLNQEETKTMNRPITNAEIKTVI